MWTLPNHLLLGRRQLLGPQLPLTLLALQQQSPSHLLTTALLLLLRPTFLNLPIR